MSVDASIVTNQDIRSAAKTSIMAAVQGHFKDRQILDHNNFKPLDLVDSKF